MCELLKAAQRLAKQKGLDPRTIVCPTDRQIICTETQCLTAGLGFDASETLPSGQIDKFYKKVEKSLAEMQKHH